MHFFRMLFIGTALLLTTQPLLAQSAATTSDAPDTLTREARQRWDEGIRALEKRDYEAARVAFKQAYALKPLPPVLRNLAASEIQSGHTVEGARSLAKYLRLGQPLTDNERRDLDRMLGEAQSRVGQLAIEVNAADADVFVDDEPVGRTPLGFTWHVTPGEHVVRVKKAGVRDEEKKVSAQPAQTAKVTITLQAETTSPSSSPRPSASQNGPDRSPTKHAGERSMLPLYVAGGVAAVGVAGGIIFEIARHSNASDAEDVASRIDPNGCGAGTSTPNECSELRDDNDAKHRFENYRNVAFVLAGVGAAVAIGYLVWPNETKSTGSASIRSVARKRNFSDVALAPAVTANGAGIWFLGKF